MTQEIGIICFDHFFPLRLNKEIRNKVQIS